VGVVGSDSVVEVVVSVMYCIGGVVGCYVRVSGIGVGIVRESWRGNLMGDVGFGGVVVCLGWGLD
jgi:hypothetical protein